MCCKQKEKLSQVESLQSLLHTPETRYMRRTKVENKIFCSLDKAMCSYINIISGKELASLRVTVLTMAYPLLHQLENPLTERIIRI